MKSILLSLALVALFGQGRAEESEQAPAVGGGLFGGRLQGVIEPRLAANAIRIHDLEEHIEKLKTKIEEAKHADPQRFINDLKARLTELEGTHCDDHEFQCGNNGQECISDLFVCDGHKDCHNGHDEDPDVCDASAIKAGKTFSGITHWTDCVKLEDHTSHLTIVGTRRAHFFSSRIGVHAFATAVYKQKNGEEKKRHFELVGGYNFANRRLYLVPKNPHDDTTLSVACVFDHGDFERLDCTLQTEASEHVCAEQHLSLQHTAFEDKHDDHDDHDDDDDDDDHEHDNYFDRLFKRGHDDDDDDDDHDDDDHDDHHGKRRHHRRHHRDH